MVRDLRRVLGHVDRQGGLVEEYHLNVRVRVLVEILPGHWAQSGIDAEAESRKNRVRHTSGGTCEQCLSRLAMPSPILFSNFFCSFG